jgi:hypothetical protein
MARLEEDRRSAGPMTKGRHMPPDRYSWFDTFTTMSTSPSARTPPGMAATPGR